MTTTPTPKPRQEVLSPKKVDNKLTPIERAIERSDIKIDVAACIRSTLAGLAVVILAIGKVIYPDILSISDALQSITNLLAK